MQHGASAERVEAALGDYKKSAVFSPREKLALELCVRMTYTGKRVTDGFFNRLKKSFSEEEMVELAAIIALENFHWPLTAFVPSDVFRFTIEKGFPKDSSRLSCAKANFLKENRSTMSNVFVFIISRF